MRKDNKAKTLAFSGLMAALANIFSLEFFTLPLIFGSRVHFTQMPIFISGAFAGPWAGLIAGAIGGLYMGYSAGIPPIIGGLALLGFSAGFFAKRLRLRPFFSSIFAWCIQAPYVFVTDYLWFIYTRPMPPPIALAVVGNILIKLTVEAVVSSVLSEVLIHYIQKSGLTF